MSIRRRHTGQPVGIVATVCAHAAQKRECRHSTRMTPSTGATRQTPHVQTMYRLLFKDMYWTELWWTEFYFYFLHYFIYFRRHLYVTCYCYWYCVLCIAAYWQLLLLNEYQSINQSINADCVDVASVVWVDHDVDSVCCCCCWSPLTSLSSLVVSARNVALCNLCRGCGLWVHGTKEN